MSAPALRSFRLVCPPEHVPLVEDLLRAQGFAFAPEPFFPLARRLLHEPVPLGSSLAALFGYMYIQDRSSMLPPLVLAPCRGAAVLDMCASPGSKTGLLGQLTGPTGFVLGNEPARNRLATLRRNLQSLNLFWCATCSHAGERLPLPGADALPDGDFRPGWDAIQLDPPCSGWGTADKHPQVLRLWQADKVQPLIALQRRLLAEAARLLRPGGLVVYSTCTTNAAENEAQVIWARDTLGLLPLPVTPPPGFSFAPSASPDLDGILRVESGGDGQGFFVALLQKPVSGGAGGDGREGAPDSGPWGAPGEATRQGPDGLARPDAPEDPDAPAAPAAPPAPPAPGENVPGPGAAEASTAGGRGFFVRPWEKESRFVGERRRHGRSRERSAASPAFDCLPREALAGAYVDPDLLPPGDIAVFSGVAHFLPLAARAALPGGFAWKGFPLGRVDGRGGVRVAAHLRGLMPSIASLSSSLPGPVSGEERREALNLEDIAPLRDLLDGRGLPVRGGIRELGLYYKDLPLCRLSVRGGRAVLPPL